MIPENEIEVGSSYWVRRSLSRCRKDYSKVTIKDINYTEMMVFTDEPPLFGTPEFTDEEGLGWYPHELYKTKREAIEADIKELNVIIKTEQDELIRLKQRLGDCINSRDNLKLLLESEV